MSETEIEEHVARAICRASVPPGADLDHLCGICLGDEARCEWDVYLQEARAAIAAYQDATRQPR